MDFSDRWAHSALLPLSWPDNIDRFGVGRAQHSPAPAKHGSGRATRVSMSNLQLQRSKPHNGPKS
eukprot:12143178-Alexandrium_andersonii.AAC.1